MTTAVPLGSSIPLKSWICESKRKNHSFALLRPSYRRVAIYKITVIPNNILITVYSLLILK